jgi:O-antigen/teichoic acid export membrane protein
MKDLLGRLSKNTLIYGLGTVAQSLLQFVLVPLYTRVFSEESYGAFALLLSVLAMGDIVFRLGLQFAFLTLFFHQPTDDDRQRLGRTTWTALLLQAGLLLLTLFPLTPYLVRVLLISAEHTLALQLIFVSLFFSTPTALLLSVMRSADRSKAFIALNVGQLALTLLMNVLFVLVLRQGVRGAFLGYVVSGAVFGLWSTVKLARTYGFGITTPALRELYALGASYAVANVLAQGFVYSNRWFLAALGSLRDVALFDLGYRASMVISLLVVSPFSVAWATGLFAVAESARPRETFARLLSYFLAILCFVALAVALFAREGILILGGARYLEAAAVVPWIATAYVFFGAYSFLTMGPALRKRSGEIVAATFAALVVNVALNLLLIPRWQVLGASMASLASFFVLALAMYVGAQRCYRVEYELGRGSRVLLLYGATLVVGTLASRGTAGSVALRALLLLSFPLQLWAVSFFPPGELASLRHLVASMYGRRTETG